MKQLKLHTLFIFPSLKNLCLALVFCLAGNLAAQTGPLIINIENAVGSNNVTVDFKVDNFVDMTSVQFTSQWDSNKLQFDSISNKIDDELFYGPTVVDDVLRISWIDPTVQGKTVPDGSIFFSIHFTILEAPGSEITIVDIPPTVTEVSRIIYSQIVIIPLVVNPGSVISNGATIEGNVFADLDADCMLDTSEFGLNQWQVVLEGPNTYFASTNSAGNYRIIADTGSYDLYVVPPNDYWAPCQTFNLQLDTNQQVTRNLPVNEVISCPSMNVDVSTPFLRRCFSNFYSVDYCNNGTATGTGSYVEIDLDPAMHFIIASLPVQSINGTVHTFDLGDVDPGECGSFTFEVILDCDSTQLGETHCVSAHIYPDQLCTAPPSAWSGANLEVEGSCDGNNVTFQITNTGTGDMVAPSNYIVIEDVIMRDEQSFQLNSGENLAPIVLPANGSTYRVEAYQVDAHPGQSMPSFTIEGCGTNSNGEFSMGFVNQFAQNDGDEFISIDCQENIGAFDPNDKLAFPEGYSDEHFIESNTDLEYMIRFQNTGTDTAFNVVILDTLSANLDMNSFQLGASSHPVELIVQGKDTVVLKFRFAGIMLPDSNVNEAASHGFVKFKIAQQPDLEDGEMITNAAGIYFDFNKPIQTNTVFHTIGREFVTVKTQEIYVPNVSLKAYPNPAVETVTFELDGLQFSNIQFKLYDIMGRLVRNEQHSDSIFEFQRRGLTTGMYLYKIESDGIEIGAGKLQLH